MWRGAGAIDGFAFDDFLAELPEGPNEGWVVTGTGEVHGGFEFVNELGVAEGVEGATDVGLDGVEFAAEFGVGFDFPDPLLAHS